MIRLGVAEETVEGAVLDEKDGDDSANSEELLVLAALLVNGDGKAEEMALDSDECNESDEFACIAGELSERWKKGADSMLSMPLLLPAGKFAKPGGARMGGGGPEGVEEWVRCSGEGAGHACSTNGEWD